MTLRSGGSKVAIGNVCSISTFSFCDVATLITIAVALPVFKCADKKTYIDDSFPNTFVVLVEATISRNDRRFSIRDLDLGPRLSARSFCRCFCERILRAVSFSGDPFPSVARLVWSNGACNIFRTAILLYTCARARSHCARRIFDLFVENIKNIGNFSAKGEKKRITIDNNA